MTGQEIFDIAIHIMDEQHETTGATITADTKDYRFRAVDLINSLGQECYTLSDTCQAEDGARPVFPKLRDLQDTVGLDDYVAGVILPYGLAYLLVQGEDSDPGLANTCLQRYQELKAEARRLMPAGSFQEIERPYGGLELGEFSRW